MTHTKGLGLWGGGRRLGAGMAHSSVPRCLVPVIDWATRLGRKKKKKKRKKKAKRGGGGGETQRRERERKRGEGERGRERERERERNRERCPTSQTFFASVFPPPDVVGRRQIRTHPPSDDSLSHL